MENLFTKIDTTHGVCYNFSTYKAAANLGMRPIVIELDKEYFNKGFESIKEIQTKIVFK